MQQRRAPHQPGSRHDWTPGPVLGIETSCDETAAAVLSAEGVILAERLHSQSDAHRAYGGVVPEIAARAHLQVLPEMVRAVLAEAGLAPGALAAVGATTGPGLVGGLIVGSMLGKGLALAADCPFLAINHLEAHALTARLPALKANAAFPYLLMLVSGGHCLCVLVRGIGAYQRLGGTLDDAAGEAFDKVGKLLGLPWPGGPALERLAATGNPAAVPLPRPLLGRPGCDFSFSGLKTAVAQRVGRPPPDTRAEAWAANIAASFQQSVAAVIADRTTHAIAAARAQSRLVQTVVLAGGVAANATVRAAVGAAAAAAGCRLICPPIRLCTDNAVMVAWAAFERLQAGAIQDDLDRPATPRWTLDSLTPPTPPPAPPAAAAAAAAVPAPAPAAR